MKNVWLISLLLVVAPVATIAETAEQKGLAIAMEADKRNDGFGDSEAVMVMTLKNRHGEESHREIRIKTLEVEGDGDKSMSIFDTPLDVKGTVFLNHTHKTEDDDQWLYLPAIEREKRITSRNKSGPFMGSEFAYEDISSQEVEKYTYKYIGDEQKNGQDCFVIERYPVNENSGYTRQVVWIDKQEYRTIFVEFYDRKNALLKELTWSDYKQYLNQYWRPGKMHMINKQNGKETILLWQDYQFRTGLKDSDFSRNSLKRVR